MKQWLDAVSKKKRSGGGGGGGGGGTRYKMTLAGNSFNYKG